MYHYCFQMLSKVFDECLTDAIKDNCGTIAFPCVGGGDLCYDQSAVFHCLQQAVEKLRYRHLKNFLEASYFFILY